MARQASAGRPDMIRGSVVTHRRKCGKRSCRCADGQTLHETTVLSYSEAGRTRLLTLPAAEIAAVRAATDRYEAMVGFLDGTGAAAMLHAQLEEQLDTQGRALINQLLQDHLDLRAARE